MSVVVGLIQSHSIGGFSRQKNSRVEVSDIEGIGSSKPVQAACLGQCSLDFLGSDRSLVFLPIERLNLKILSEECRHLVRTIQSTLGKGLKCVKGVSWSRRSVWPSCRNVSLTIEFHEFLCVQFGWIYRGSVGLSSKVKHSGLAPRDNRDGDPRVTAMLVHRFGTHLGWILGAIRIIN